MAKEWARRVHVCMAWHRESNLLQFGALKCFPGHGNISNAITLALHSVTTCNCKFEIAIGYLVMKPMSELLTKQIPGARAILAANSRWVRARVRCEKYHRNGGVAFETTDTLSVGPLYIDALANSFELIARSSTLSHGNMRLTAAQNIVAKLQSPLECRFFVLFVQFPVAWNVTDAYRR